MTTNEINIIDVSKKYSSYNVLNHINLTLKKGEILGLIGPNGAGKTTLMSIILGLIRNYSGEVLIDGENIRNKKQKKYIGCLIENPSLYPNLTGLENLNYFSAFLGKKQKNNTNEIIKSLKLEEFINKKVKTYSLGMKQRLGMGVALLGKPEYLILDEPMNGIDAQQIPDIRIMLRKIAHDENKGILISSHILSEIEAICDRVVILKDGIIVKNMNIRSDSKAELGCNCIISTPDKEKVKKYLNSNQYLSKEYKNDIIVMIPDGDIEKLLQTLILNGFRISQISKYDKTLENEFLDAIRGEK